MVVRPARRRTPIAATAPYPTPSPCAAVWLGCCFEAVPTRAGEHRSPAVARAAGALFRSKVCCSTCTRVPSPLRHERPVTNVFKPLSGWLPSPWYRRAGAGRSLVLAATRPSRRRRQTDVRSPASNSFRLRHWRMRSVRLSSPELLACLRHEPLFDDRRQAGIAHGSISFMAFENASRTHRIVSARRRRARASC